MKKAKVLSVGAQVKIGNTLSGLFWIGAGIFGLFNHLVCSIAEIVFLAMAIICYVILLTYKKEKSDEMAETNMDAASADALHTVRLILMISALVIARVPGSFLSTLDWNDVFPSFLYMILGVLDVRIGVAFKQYEVEE